MATRTKSLASSLRKTVEKDRSHTTPHCAPLRPMTLKKAAKLGTSTTVTWMSEQRKKAPISQRFLNGPMDRRDLVIGAY